MEKTYTSSLRGRSHEVNEDRVIVLGESPPTIFGVFDGMGEVGGDSKPEIICEYLKGIYPDFSKNFKNISLWELSFHSNLMEILDKGLEEMNKGFGGASGVLGLCPIPNVCYVYSLGDVGCYLAGKSLEQFSVIKYPLSGREPEIHGCDGALLEYFGGRKEFMPKIRDRTILIADESRCRPNVIREFAQGNRFHLIEEGESLVMASDGVWENLLKIGYFRRELRNAIKGELKKCYREKVEHREEGNYRKEQDLAVQKAVDLFVENARKNSRNGDDCTLAVIPFKTDDFLYHFCKKIKEENALAAQKQ